MRTHLPALLSEIRKHRAGFADDPDAVRHIHVAGEDELVLAMNRPGLNYVKSLIDRLHVHEGESHHFHLDPWGSLDEDSKSIVLSLVPDSWFDEPSADSK